MMTAMITSAASSIFDAGSLRVSAGWPCALGEGVEWVSRGLRGVRVPWGGQPMPRMLAAEARGPSRGSERRSSADVAESPREEVHRVPDRAEHRHTGTSPEAALDRHRGCERRPGSWAPQG